MIIAPTIDVEGVHGDQPFDQMILGEIGDRETWGAMRLARIFKRFDISATFFVDCYESSLWGEARMERVCHELLDLGQDVQLHTHPGWRDDPRDADWLRRHKRKNSFLSSERDFMAKLSLADQTAVLQAGIEMFERWIGRRPIAHRSGGYSINADTVRALGKTGIAVDSSMNASHPNSQLVWSSNSVVKKDGVLEFPVTILKYSYGLPVAGRHQTVAGKLMKTDINACSAADLQAYVDQGEKAGLKMLNLFMHSYSLLNCNPFLRPTYSKIVPSLDRLRELESFLKTSISDSRLRFMSLTEAMLLYQQSPKQLCGPDFVPSIYSPKTVLYHAHRKVQRRVSKVWSVITGAEARYKKRPRYGREAA